MTEPLATPAAEVAAAPPPEPPPPPFELEAEFQKALAQLRSPARSRWNTGLLLIGSLALYLLWQSANGWTLLDVAVLVAVLLLHESGHWVAMRAFGYQDLKMFFIPGFGAAVSGRQDGVEAWKQVVVSLAGPIPGIVVGTALALVIRTEGPPLLRSATFMLVAVNAFNLLPLAALDGGRVLELAVFQRRRGLEVGFTVAAAIAMAGVSFWMELRGGAYLAMAALFGLPARWRLMKAAHALRGSVAAPPSGLRDADGPGGRDVFRAAWALSRDEKRGASEDPAPIFERLLALVARVSPTGRQTAALLAAWAVGLAASAGGIWLLRHPAMWWRTVSGPGDRYAIELPAEPAINVLAEDLDPAEAGPLEPVRELKVANDHFVFQVVDVPGIVEGEEDLRATTAEFAQRTTAKGQVVFDRPARRYGRLAQEAMVTYPDITLRLVALHHGGHRLVLFAATAPGEDAADRFLDSLQLR